MTTTTIRKQRHQRHKRLPKGERGGIELLLIQNVEHLGKQGEVVEVRPGYASNYLLLRGLQQLLPNITREWWKSTRKSWLLLLVKDLLDFVDCSKN